MTDDGGRPRVLVRSEALERVTDGVVALDTDLRYTYVNEPAEELLGRTASELRGTSVWDSVGTGILDREHVERALETQQQVSFERHRPDEDRWVEVRLYPGVAGFSVYFTDITDRKRTEAALRRQNRRLEAVVDNTGAAIYSKDIEGHYEFVNRTTAELFGLTPEEVVGKRDDELFDAESAAAVRAVDEHIVEHDEADRREAVRYVDGEEHVFLDDKFPSHDEHGAVTGVMGISRDITERKRRERALERYRAFIENISEVVSVVDEDHVVQYVSPASRQGNGFDPEWYVGRHAVAHVHPDDEPRVEAALSRSRATPDETQTVEYRIQRADGSWGWVESTAVNRLEDDVVRGFIIVTRDVTDRKRRERERAEFDEEYRVVFENADDSIFLVDVESPDGDVEFRYNRLGPSHESQTGLTSVAVEGKTPREVLGEEQGAEVEANYRYCVDRKTPVTYDEVLALPGGENIWQTKLAPVVVDGEVTRIVGISRDITDRVERERELKRRNERLDEFASVISHDIRNPLSVALGRTRILEEESKSEHIPPILRSLIRIEAIVDDTLTLARQGRTVDETELIDIESLVGQCWGTVDVAGATLETTDEFTIRGDRNRLRHVFENLFRNSIEHGGAGVTVRVGRLGDDGLHVEDDGPGIPEAEHQTVFEPGHKSAAGGTGFGLTIVRRIAEAHGWTVSVADSSTGGARFEFRGVDIVD